MRYKATYYCYQTSDGWGKIGAYQTISGIEATSIEEAAREAKFICPGNWRAIQIAEQPEPQIMIIEHEMVHAELFDAKGG